MKAAARRVPDGRKGATAARGSDGDRRAVELREGDALEEAVAVLVVGRAVVAQDADRDLLAQEHRLERVRPPVDAGDVAAGGDVRGDLVELAADGQGRAAVGDEREAVRAHLDR